MPLRWTPSPVQYLTISDGYSIAYAIRGAGTLFVIMPSVFDNVQLAWQYAGLVSGLSAFLPGSR